MQVGLGGDRSGSGQSGGRTGLACRFARGAQEQLQPVAGIAAMSERQFESHQLSEPEQRISGLHCERQTTPSSYAVDLQAVLSAGERTQLVAVRAKLRQAQIAEPAQGLRRCRSRCGRSSRAGHLNLHRFRRANSEVGRADRTETVRLLHQSRVELGSVGQTAGWRQQHKPAVGCGRRSRFGLQRAFDDDEETSRTEATSAGFGCGHQSKAHFHLPDADHVLVGADALGSSLQADVAAESAASDLDQDRPLAGAGRVAGESLPGAETVPARHRLLNVHLRAAAQTQLRSWKCRQQREQQRIWSKSGQQRESCSR